MSDFFGDSFTDDLKKFFLSNLNDEIEKYIGAIDKDTWEIFKEELVPLLDTWSVDAQSNEFASFSGWLLQAKLVLVKQAKDEKSVRRILDFVKSYQEELQKALKDSEDLARKFELSALDTSRSLYLHCSYQDSDFLIPAGYVLEVLGKVKVSALPLSQSKIIGMIPFRGDAIPVLNLDDQADQDLERSHYFVICDVSGSRFALPVQEADRLIEVMNSSLQTVNQRTEHLQAPYITHYTHIDQKNMYIFELEKLVNL